MEITGDSSNGRSPKPWVSILSHGLDLGYPHSRKASYMKIQPQSIGILVKNQKWQLSLGPLGHSFAARSPAAYPRFIGRITNFPISTFPKTSPSPKLHRPMVICDIVT
jgi:hypothetical protein